MRWFVFSSHRSGQLIDIGNLMTKRNAEDSTMKPQSIHKLFCSGAVSEGGGNMVLKLHAVGTFVALASSTATPKNAIAAGHVVHSDVRYDLYVLKPERSEYTSPFWKMRVVKPNALTQEGNAEPTHNDATTSLSCEALAIDESWFTKSKMFTEINVMIPVATMKNTAMDDTTDPTQKVFELVRLRSETELAS